MISDLEKINKKLVEVLGPERGYLGRIFTWGQKPTEYEFIGYELTGDFSNTLKNMSDEQKKALLR